MNLNYLWIDSLCIIQDGDGGQDWLQQINQVQDLYGSCALNIVAAHGQDAHQGCLSMKPRAAASLAGLSYPQLHGNSAPIYERQIERRRPVISNIVPPHNDFRTNERGWILQERMLAPRVVHFDIHEVFGECSEWVVDGKMQRCGSRIWRKQFGSPLFHWKQPGDNVKLSLDHWSILIRDYSSKQLTRPEDRLIAFSDVSYRLCHYYQEQYIAGFC